MDHDRDVGCDLHRYHLLLVLDQGSLVDVEATMVNDQETTTRRLEAITSLSRFLNLMKSYGAGGFTFENPPTRQKDLIKHARRTDKFYTGRRSVCWRVLAQHGIPTW